MCDEQICGRIALTLAALCLATALGACASAPRTEGNPADRAWGLPALRLETLAGDTKDLQDWQGKVILLNFWATWCGPCQAEVPHLIRYQNQYGGDGLQVVGVALDERRKVRNVARTLRINYPVMLADPATEDKLLPQWGNVSRGLPFTVVIGRDGRVRCMLNGILDQETFADIVRPLLQDHGQPQTPS